MIFNLELRSSQAIADTLTFLKDNYRMPKENYKLMKDNFKLPSDNYKGWLLQIANINFIRVSFMLKQHAFWYHFWDFLYLFKIIQTKTRNLISQYKYNIYQDNPFQLPCWRPWQISLNSSMFLSSSFLFLGILDRFDPISDNHKYL